MGKRRHHDEDYIDRKIRKLEKKRSKIRTRHRRHSSWSSSSDSMNLEPHRYYYSDYSVQGDVVEPDQWQEDSQNEGPPMISFNLTDDVPTTSASAISAKPTVEGTSTVQPPPSPTPAINSEVVQASGSNDDTPNPTPEVTADLEPDVLLILGDEPEVEEKFSPPIQKEIATRWSNLLVNGLKEETKKEILQQYDAPENFKLVMAPILNPEIKAASNENVLKRDNILIEKQKLLATAITSIARSTSMLLSEGSKDCNHKNQLLKSLSDAGRLLCHLHFSESQTRRNFLLSSLNKDVKDNIKNLKRDNLLFGNELQENLKSMKAISKTGAEIKHSISKPKPPPNRKQTEASSSRALNWRGGPTPAPPPPPRRAQAKSNSTSGGRRQPPAPPRRASDRRAPPPRHHGRTARR